MAVPVADAVSEGSSVRGGEAPADVAAAAGGLTAERLVAAFPAVLASADVGAVATEDEAGVLAVAARPGD